MAIDWKVCIWCGGGDGDLVCVLCDQVIPCMFCGGTGKFSAVQQFPAHVCEDVLAAMKTKSTTQ